MYLQPLRYLDIKEDERIWTMEGQLSLEKELTLMLDKK
jgi:hypothetical protein